MLHHLCSQTLFTEVITDVFSIKEFLARGTCVCSGHWLIVQHQSGKYNLTILFGEDGYRNLREQDIDREHYQEANARIEWFKYRMDNKQKETNG